MKIKTLLALCIFSTSLAFGQVGIGVTLPEKELDVKGDIRFRDIQPIHNSPDVSEYDRQLVVSKEGDLATVPIFGEPNAYRLRNVYYKNMNAPVKSNVKETNRQSDLNLGLEIKVSIPPYTESLILIDYSVPIMITATVDASIFGYLGITFKKDTAELDQASRKNTLPTHFNMPAGGFAVSGKAVDAVINKTGKTITHTYKAVGYIEENKQNRMVTFGMYSNTGANYNWGKGAMTIQVFDRNVE